MPAGNVATISVALKDLTTRLAAPRWTIGATCTSKSLPVTVSVLEDRLTVTLVILGGHEGPVASACWADIKSAKQRLAKIRTALLGKNIS
jgi:hypothetical protein